MKTFLNVFVLIFFLCCAFLYNCDLKNSQPGFENKDSLRIAGDLTGPWILMVDDYALADKAKVTRSYYPFIKYEFNPVLVADKPWEGQSAYLYGTVLPNQNGKGYRMWYHTYHPDKSFGGKRGYANCYAVSEDGLHWKKPYLGIYEFKNSTNNNMFLTRRRSPGDDHHPQVIYTPWETDPQKRYKLLTFAYYDGYWASTSPDGIHWTDVKENPVLEDPGDVANFNWDPHKKRYIGYPKIWVNNVRGFKRRCVGFTATTDFEKWPASKLVLQPDEYDDRWIQHPDAHTDFYGLSAFPYESIYIGFLWIYRIAPGNNRIHIELVSSHDGVNWIRQEKPRPAILELGKPGEWDAGMLFTTNFPLVEENRIRLYYGGADKDHEAKGTRLSIGLATLRKDGFASLDAENTTGVITTHFFKGADGFLHVNVDTDSGYLKAEVLDEHGNVIKGYSRNESRPIKIDGIDEIITWRTKSTLPDRNKPIALRFYMENASIYSFKAGNNLEFIK